MTAPRTPAPDSLGALRQVPYMGVIHVLAEAGKVGWSMGDPSWSNLGQGQPEPGEMAGAPARIKTVELDPGDHAYGPLEGLPELRQSIADDYNRRFRQGKKPYGPQHVAIASGGRLALTRIMAALDAVAVGYQLPDYTAYEDMFNLHLGRLRPVPVACSEERGFRLDLDCLRTAIHEEQLGAFLLSNPTNPTGVSLRGEELNQLVALARDPGTTLILDEFYSHFIYDVAEDGTATPGAGPVSGAAYVEDPDQDPVLIVDGMTKNHRYPGWRLGWVLGPQKMVEAIARTASSIDGGPSRPSQRATCEALQPARADAETDAVRQVFCAKRNRMVEVLSGLGVRFAATPDSTFYCWGNVSTLPAPWNTSQGFFRAALERRVITVPGEAFDVNPGGVRTGPAAYSEWLRFSFGPDMENMEAGLQRLVEGISG